MVNKEEEKTKICRICKESKPISLFGRDFSQRVKRYYVRYCCRKCDSIESNLKHKISGYTKTERYKELRRATMKKYSENHPVEVAARKAFRNAVQSGKIKPQPCFCGNLKSQGHHHKGYAKENQYDVVWLCIKHHKEAEMILKEKLKDTK